MPDTGPDSADSAEALNSKTSAAGVGPNIARHNWLRRGAILTAFGLALLVILLPTPLRSVSDTSSPRSAEAGL